MHVPQPDAAAARARRQHDAGRPPPGAQRRHDRRGHAAQHEHPATPGQPAHRDRPRRPRPGGGTPPPEGLPGPEERLAEGRRQAPLARGSDPRLATVFAGSTEALGSLRIFDPEHADRAVIAAGPPWFMTIFGRDSLITSWMVLPLDPSLALGTMRTLASLQGTKVTPATEEEPGKIQIARAHA